MPLLLFFINPFIAFLNAMKDLERKYAGWVYVAFYGLFGFAISFTLTTADSYRIAARFCQTNYVNDNIWDMYQAGAITDFYLMYVYSIVKVFTNNPKVLYGVLGLIMGAFSYLSVKQLYSIWKIPKDRYFYILVLCYFCAVSFVNINGIRFWTATSVFTYFAIQSYYFNNKKAIFGVLCVPLIHFGFLVVVPPFILFLLLKKVLRRSTTVLFMITTLMLIFTSLGGQGIAEELMNEEYDDATSSKAINTKIKNYKLTDENTSKKNKKTGQSLYRKANSAYTKLLNNVNKYGTYVLLLLIYKRHRKIREDKADSDFFNLVLFLFSVSYLAVSLIGSGGRFVIIANMFLIFYMALIYQKNVNVRLKKYVKSLILLNFYSISFIIINAPRLVTGLLWSCPWPITVFDGIGFGSIDFV